MSTDLRALMQSLAADAPAMDDSHGLADRTYKAGRRRRAVRHAVVSTASAVALLLMLSTALFAGPTPLAAQYGTSGGTVVSGHPKEIGPQWPVLDLPDKPGPIAALLSSRNGWWAVSASGHRWDLPGISAGDSYPALSPDGRMIAYLKGTRGEFVLRDLVSGRARTVPGIGPDRNDDPSPIWVQPETQMVFSDDDRYLAFTAARGGVTVVDVAAAKVVRRVLRSGYEWTAGWWDDQLVTASATTVSLMSLSGPAVQMPLRPPLPEFAVTQNSGVVAPDGILVFLSRNGQGLQVITRYDLHTGARRALPAIVPSTDLVSSFVAGDAAYYTHTDSVSGADTVLAVDAEGTVTASVHVTRRLAGYGGVWAATALSGRGHSRLALDRVGGWVSTHPSWVTWSVLLLALATVLTWRLPRAVRGRAAPRRNRRRSRRARVTTLGALAVVIVVSGAVLTKYVFVPMAVGNLVAGQAPLWWSPVDQAAARAGAYEGDPASHVPERPGQQQGIAVLVRNPTDHDQLIEADADQYRWHVTVSTTNDSVTQARSLTYRPSGTIPAHQARWVRLLGQTEACQGNDKGGSSGTPTLSLHVRVGWVTRTEVISTKPAMMLDGVCAHADTSASATP